MDVVEIGGVEVSRFILGSNPFSGFAHQGPERSEEMLDYYTAARIKETIREAEVLGVNTILGRADIHMTRLLREYWNEGSEIQWLAQTCPELGSPDVAIRRAIKAGAKACYIHGGVMDFHLAQGRLDEIPPYIQMIRDAGLGTGVAGHDPEVFRWAEENLDLDFYMCSYYNPTPRDDDPEHKITNKEVFRSSDRDAMTALIPVLKRPVIHYKIMAAGRNDPIEAFQKVTKTMRPEDAVCVGIYAKDKPGMIRENIGLLEKGLSEEEL